MSAPSSSHAQDEAAQRFYADLGFEPFPGEPLTLYRLVKRISGPWRRDRPRRFVFSTGPVENLVGTGWVAPGPALFSGSHGYCLDFSHIR